MARQYITVTDVPEEFLYAELNKAVPLLLEGKIAELILCFK